MAPGKQVDVDFPDPKTPIVRQDYQVAVPVLSEVNLVHHLPAKRLHGVQVSDRHPEDHARESIVDPRHHALRIIPHLAPHHHVVVFIQRIQEAGNLVRGVLEVRVEQHEHGRVSRPHGRHQGRRLPPVDPMSQEDGPILDA